MKRVWLVLTLMLGALFFLALGIAIGFFAPKFLMRESRTFLNSATVIRQVQTLSQLVTVSYVMEKVVDVQDVKWSETFGTSRVLLLAHGVVKAGVDLKKLQANDVRISGKKISLTLPPAQITDAYLDENQTQILERTTGLLRTFDKDLESAARQQALDDIRRAARKGGILKDADAKAREQLANLFHQLGFDTVEFRDAGWFSSPPGPG